MTVRSGGLLDRGAFWWVLLITGQLAALSLIAAGPRVGYQHYTLTAASPTQWAAWVVLGMQAVLVVAGLRRRWGLLRAWQRRALGLPTLGVLVGCVILTSAPVSKDVAAFVRELLVAGAIQLVAAGTVVLAGIAPSRAAERLGAWIVGTDAPQPAPLIDRFSLGAAAWVLVASAALAIFSYQRHPHVPDEVVYLLHARFLAEGQLSLPLPPAPMAFNIDLMHYEATRWFSPVPPGWPFVLAIGAFVGAPWLVNPVLGAGCVLLAYATLVSAHGRTVARLTTFLLATSPWFVFMSMNIMTHQLTLALALAAALVVSRLRLARGNDGEVRRRWWFFAFCGGLATGGVSLVRPLEGLAVALLLGPWSLPTRWWGALGTARWRAFVPSAMLALGTVAGGALVRPYNRMMTGDPSYFPIMAYIDKYYTPGANDLGFGANRGLGWSGLDPYPGHGLRDVVVNANLNVTSISGELLGWATGSLVLALLVLALRRLTREDGWHLAVVVMIAGIHSVYWFSGGPDFGARYWYLLLPSALVLTVRGALRLAQTPQDAASTLPLPRIAGTVVLLGFLSVGVYWPWRAIDKYYHYRGMRPDIREMVNAGTFGRGLVFVRGKRHPDYASAVPYNPLDLRDATVPVFAWASSQAAVREALAAYPDRHVWIVDGPTRTGRGFVIHAGPLTGADAAQALADLGTQ